MQWLVANMWMALAAAAVLGLFFGFSFRGMMSSGRVRKAEVEREIAKTELTQSKAEAEALYAAQRKQKEETRSTNSSESLQAELNERETRIASLGEELGAAREELDRLKSEADNRSNLGEVAGAAVAGAVAGAVLSDDDQAEMLKLKDRNAWLEDRVGALETDIAAAQSATNAAIAEPAPAVTEASPGPDIEKLRWQSSYMRHRVKALETKLIAQTAEASTASSVPEQIAELVEPPVTEPEPSNQVDEELAELRWRNRYLEGRLAYFEQSPDPEDDVDTSGEAEAAIVEPVSDADSDSDTSEPEPAEGEVVEAGDEPDAESGTPPPANEEEVHPSEAMLAELEGTQPVQVERPSSGGDDLTTITGIGPRIAEVLNSLSIWTFAQIAEWQPEHETWVENHLSFKGRVSRENWVGQAKDLLVSA